MDGSGANCDQAVDAFHLLQCFPDFLYTDLIGMEIFRIQFYNLDPADESLNFFSRCLICMIVTDHCEIAVLGIRIFL